VRLLSRTETGEETLPREAREHDEAVRKARIKAAQNCTAWTEITPPERLCARGPSRFRWVVDSETDRLYSPYPGDVFYARSATIVADRVDLTFVVDDGEVLAYQAVRSPATWSDVIRARPELASS
jgi:hypothetical protein